MIIGGLWQIILKSAREKRSAGEDGKVKKELGENAHENGARFVTLCASMDETKPIGRGVCTFTSTLAFPPTTESSSKTYDSLRRGTYQQRSLFATPSRTHRDHHLVQTPNGRSARVHLLVRSSRSAPKPLLDARQVLASTRPTSRQPARHGRLAVRVFLSRRNRATGAQLATHLGH